MWGTEDDGTILQLNIVIDGDHLNWIQCDVCNKWYIVEGMSPDASKIDSILNWPRPKCQKYVKQFLGLASYYRRYIKNLASIADPFNRLLGKYNALTWEESEVTAFTILKELLSSDPVLVCPDFEKVFTLCTDASGTGLGAVLEQEGHPVVYFSRSLRGANNRYSTVELECLGIVESLKRFRHYLLGREFRIITYRKPLEWL